MSGSVQRGWIEAPAAGRLFGDHPEISRCRPMIGCLIQRSYHIRGDQHDRLEVADHAESVPAPFEAKPAQVSERAGVI